MTKIEKSKKFNKSQSGYINHIKKTRWIHTIVLLLAILSVFFTGLLVTKSRLNWFTFFSVLACLPFAKWLIAAMVITPYKSTSKEFVDEVYNISGVLPLYFDFVFNDEKYFYNIDCICVMNHNIIGYVSNSKTTPSLAKNHLEKIIKENKFKGYTVKLWDNKENFLKRLEEMEINAQEEGYLPNKEHIALIEFLENMAL